MGYILKKMVIVVFGLFAILNHVTAQPLLKDNGQLIVRLNEKFGIPEIIYGKGISLGNTGILDKNNLDAYSKTFFERNKVFLGIKPKDIQLKNIDRISDNWHIKFQQTYKNLPVESGSIGMVVKNNDEISIIGNKYHPGISIQTRASISQNNAESIAKNYYELANKVNIQDAHLVILPIDKLTTYEYRLAWKIEVRYLANILDSKIFLIDALNGSILKEIIITASDISGTVDGYIFPTTPQSSVYPARISVPFRGLRVNRIGANDYTDSNGNYNISGQPGTNIWSDLKGEGASLFASIDADPPRTIDSYSSTSQYSWTWIDTLNHGSEYNVFYWSHYMYYYCLDNYNLDVYSPGSVKIFMYHPLPTAAAGNDIYYFEGELGNRSTIIHEYSHVFQFSNAELYVEIDNLLPSSSFKEGTAYYIAYSILNEPDISAIPYLNYTSTATPYYSEDYDENENIYYNGAIIGKALWTLRTDLGDPIFTDGLVFDAMERFNIFSSLADPDIDINADYASAILMADDDDSDPANSTPNRTTILNSFAQHHIYPIIYAPPAAPQNLVMTNAGQNGQSPVLVWDANNTEPDFMEYRIWRGNEFEESSIDWQQIGTTTNTTYTDYEVTIQTSSSSTAHYKICAVDDESTESDFSNTVATKAIWLPKTIADNDQEKDSNDTNVYETALFQNHPNPFNPHTEIRYTLSTGGEVKLVITNLLGQVVRILVNEDQPVGIHTKIWDGRNEFGNQVSSGIYLYRLAVIPNDGSRQIVDVRKLSLLR